MACYFQCQFFQLNLERRRITERLHSRIFLDTMSYHMVPQTINLDLYGMALVQKDLEEL